MELSTNVTNDGKAKAVLKYPGSKQRTADWIISHFPTSYERMTYLEPFFGSGAVFFHKQRSAIETINDIDGNVINLFRVIRDYPEELARLIRFTPWARDEYQNSYVQTGNELEDARRFLIRMWMAIGAKSSDRTGWRSNIKGLNGNLTQFTRGLPEELLKVAVRLQHADGSLVQIENQPALKLLTRYRRSNVFIYADPPYLLHTRSKRMYKYEMTDMDHEMLLAEII